MAATDSYELHLSFYFKVTFEGLDKKDNDTRFQSVSGLTVEYEFENYREGGENRFEHKLPGRTKYTDLVLKRAMLTSSGVIKWCLDAFQNRNFKPADMTISLLNEKHQPVRTWKVFRAIPKKWVVSDFSSGENTIVIETLELTYSYFSLDPDPN